MNQALFKKMVHWLGLVLLFLALGAIFKALFLQGMIVESLEHEDGAAKTITVLFALVFPITLCLNYGLHVGRESETRRLTVKQMDAADFDAKAFWKDECRINLYRVAIFLAVQLPMMIFCSMFHYSYDYQIIIEKFFAGVAGFYVMIPMALVAWILTGIYLFGLLMLTRCIQLRIWRKNTLI
jgi:hypothetical protein